MPEQVVMVHADDIRIIWSAGEVCFDCPCGETEIILIENGDEKVCECGRIYRVVHYVEVWKPQMEKASYK